MPILIIGQSGFLLFDQAAYIFRFQLNSHFGKDLRALFVTEQDLQVRLVEDSEMKACNQFHNQFYKKSRSFDQWQWEFKSNLYDSSSIPFAVAVNQGQIVGTQALIPIQMIDRTGIYWTAKSEETLVDRQFRGTKLFERIYSVLFNYAKEHNFVNIWGFTPATKALTRLNFSIPGRTEQLFIPFSQKAISMLLAKGPSGTQSTVKRSLRNIVAHAGGRIAQSVGAFKISMQRRVKLTGLKLENICHPTDETAEVCQRFIDRWGGKTIYRDSNYFKWRFFTNPYVRSNIAGIFFEKELLGWVAFSLGDDGMGYLIDLMLNGDESRISTESLVRELLLEAVIRIRNMGAKGIRGWHVNDHPFDRIVTRVAKKVGFFHIKRGHAFVLFNCDAGSSRSSADNFNEWYITRAFTQGLHG